jgi:hypothetical protein
VLELNHCLKTVSDGGISERSDFASRIKDTYLTFTLNCRSDYLVAYPQKEQKTYKDFKRKRNSRRELQGRVNHCFIQVSHGGVVSKND